MGDFSLSIAQWAAKTKADMDRVCRAIALELHTQIVLETPVGNPDLWKANAEAALQRSQHNAVVDQITANLMSNPDNLGPKGGLKRGARGRYNKRLSKSELAKMYPNKQGRGYVGGRARGNWQLTMHAPATSEIDRIDPTGNESIAAAAAALSTFTAGPSIYITNCVPYARRLEYGWSTQSPAGMVRVAVAGFQQVVNRAVQSTQREEN